MDAVADITTIGNSKPAVTSMQAAFIECFAYAYLLFNVFSTHPWHTSMHNLQSWSNSRVCALSCESCLRFRNGTLFLSIPWFVAARRVLRSSRFIPFTRTVALSILGYPMPPSYYFGKPLKAVLLYSFHPLVSTVATAVA
jgi:hypothetical protein